jgi:dihydrofolate reductase
VEISLIVAVAANGVIGRDGGLPWHLPDDLKRFKQITTGHTIIMGRRTWESIAHQLPGRRMIVVSRQPDYTPFVAGVEVAASLDGALQLAQLAGETEAFVIGGAELFREALPKADRLYLTIVFAEIDGDVYYPDLDKFDSQSWIPTGHEMHPSDSKHQYNFAFMDLRRGTSREQIRWRDLWNIPR